MEEMSRCSATGLRYAGLRAQAFLPLCPLAWNEITKPWLQTQVSASLKPEITALAAIWGC